MFIAIPLQYKPSWQALPWVTVLLILVNCVVYFGWQVPEEKAVQRLSAFYAQTPLPEIEGPAYVGYLRARAGRSGKARDDQRARIIEKLVQRKNWPMLYEAMWEDGQFRTRLLAGQIVGSSDPDADTWRQARADFTPREPRPFTTHWAQSYEADAPARPSTWLTATFLHGGFAHLLGNMVFLFLFGFTLEAAMGPLLYLACYLVGGLGASALAGWAYAGMGSYGVGASGAIAALMSMYVVLYGMRRIRFFYWVLFYFNFARWPALVVLPVYIGEQLLQHFFGDAGVSYMAHLGGLLTGALLMGGLKLVRTFEDPAEQAEKRNAPSREQAARAEELALLTAKARQLANQLAFADAAQVWRQAARLAPRDVQVLGAWLDCARHEPASDDFHAAARRIFRLPTHDTAARQLLHRAWRLYLEKAKPAMRLDPAEMQALVRAFAVQQQWQDADGLARALARMNPPPEGWPQTLQQLAASLVRAGRMEQARAWLPELQRHAPGGELTRLLAKPGGLD